MKLHIALDDVSASEVELAKRLRTLAERHALDSDVFHLGHTLARQGAARIVALEPFVERYRAHHADPDGADPSGPVVSMAERVRRAAASVMGRSDVAGLALLHDLRDTYLHAQRNEINWIILVQAAKAVRDKELLDVVCRSHEEAEITGMWLRTRIKTGSAQVLAAG